MKNSDNARMSERQRRELEETFCRHINQGQVRYLKAGHLDVIEERRKGIGFMDAASGRPMIDGFSSAGCFNVGRRNEEILEALDQALTEFDLGDYGLMSRAKLALARKLTSIAPGDLTRVFFAAGGGDAVDGALKLARAATGRRKILSTVKAYHGHTGFALSANGKPHYRAYCEPLMPGFSFVPFNSMEALCEQIDDDTAAVILEPVQGEAGIFAGTDEYLQELRFLCDDKGVLLIFDEIQTGFGRTGRLFACEHSGVVPDIMTVAKSLGGGLYPNAAVLYRDIPVLTDYLSRNPDFHESVAGGSDLGCAVSLKVIEYIEKAGLCGNAETQGAVLKKALLDLKRENPNIIKDVRGLGLMVGIEYIHEFMGPMMSDALARHGVFAAYSGNAPQVMRFMAPITINQEEMTRLIEAIRGAVGHMKKLLPLALPAAKLPFVLKALNSDAVQTGLFGFFRKVEDFSARLNPKSRRNA